MFKQKNFDLIWKFSNISLSGGKQWQNNGASILNCHERWSSNTGAGPSIPTAPKRSSNVFALFVRDCFKQLPADMPVKERFAMAGQQWRELPQEQKQHYQKLSTEEFIKYKTAMNNYLGSLSKDELAQLKQQQKEQIKNKTRQRIKSKLRELNYPKRGLSAYIFFIRDCLKKEYPDGNYPPVRTPEHLALVKSWSKQWHQLTAEQRKPFDEMAEADRKRYFKELEQWKYELAKPENEEKFKQLERLSKKIQVANLPADKAKLRLKRQRRVAAKIIKKRLMKKAAQTIKANKKKAVKVNKNKASKSKKTKFSSENIIE